MKRILTFVLAGAVLLSACGGRADGEVEAHEFWARAATQGGNSAAYMVIRNYSSEDVELIGASSDVADAVELHYK